MKPPDTILVDGRALSWRRLLALRRQQLAAWQANQPHQPALFDLKDDRRPASAKTAAGRLQAPLLFEWESR